VRRQAAGIVTIWLVLLLPVSAQSDSGGELAVLAALAGFTSIGVCAFGALLDDDSDANADKYARAGWFLGVGGSYGIAPALDDQSLLLDFLSLSVDDNSFGVNARGGYRCNQHLSAEAEVEWLDGFEVFSELGVVKLGIIKVEPVAVTANVKGYLLTGRYQPFLLVGGGAITAKHTASEGLTGSFRENEFVMRFGGGIDVYATENVVVSVEGGYVLPFGKLDDLDYVNVGLGLQYRF
jgi:opacity protein-like surface antigen